MLKRRIGGASKHVTRSSHLHGQIPHCKLCKSTDHVTHGMWQGRNIPLCKECKSAIGVAVPRPRGGTFKSQKVMDDREHDRYMASVYAERERREKMRAEGEAHMTRLVAKMKQDYLQVEDKMQERSHGSFGKKKRVKRAVGIQRTLW